MRARALIAMVILVAGLIAGCGGGGSSASTGSAKRAAAGPEEGLNEAGGLVGGPGPPRAGGAPRLRGARLKAALARHVFEGEMVVGEEGWVRSGVGLFWTRDGGRSWRRMAPPAPDGAPFDSVYFADPRRGWALSETGGEGDTHPSIYRTTDGGRTWRRTRLRAYQEIMPAVRASFSMVDGHELFALVKVSGDTASNYGPLFVTRDGGRQWRALPTPPHAGQLSMETPRRGWIATGKPGSRLLRTVDGGRTWVEVEPERPAGPPAPPTEESLDVGPRNQFTLPVIGPDGHGILGMTEESVEGVETLKIDPPVIWRTTDFGRTWHRGATIDPPRVTEVESAFTRRGGSLSYLVRDGDAYAVVGTDGRPGPLRPIRGLPPLSEGLTFSDARHGFAFPAFSNGFTLSVTRDGGRDWKPVPVPRVQPAA